MVEKIAIIGAGIAGITAARTLHDAGHDVTVFEKSSGTGGRLSTRRTDHGSFDHGAQYITARGTPFRALMTGLSYAGAVALWEPDGKDRDNEWHVGTPGMSSLVKPMLDGLNIKKRTRISKIVKDGKELICETEDGGRSRFDRVIVAIPSPQAHVLLAPVGGVFSALDKILYMPCWTAMFAFDDRIDALPDFYRGDDTESISWLARNNSKPNRSGTESICAQAGAIWSRDNLEVEKGEALRLMQKRLEVMAGQPLSPTFATAHRWRYARVDKPLGKPFLSDADERLFAIGDGMLGGRVEAAFVSARQLCDHLKSV